MTLNPEDKLKKITNYDEYAQYAYSTFVDKICQDIIKQIPMEKRNKLSDQEVKEAILEFFNSDASTTPPPSKPVSMLASEFFEKESRSLIEDATNFIYQVNQKGEPR